MFEIIHWVWYFAYQDGPASGETFDTEEEAKAAFKKLKGPEKMGMCISHRIKAKYQVMKVT